MSKENTQAITPMQLIATAQKDGAEVEKMQQLFELQLRWEENQAKKAYNEAIAKFKSHNVKIYKTGEVDFTFNGKRTNYAHTKLDHIVDQVVPILSNYGLSHSWDLNQIENKVHVKCKLSHIDGHSECVTLIAPPDKGAGKNSIQEVGSTVTYLQRYTLMSILGLAPQQDNDGNGDGPPVERITESQAADIYALIDELKVSENGFLGYLGFDAVENIPAEQYKRAIAALESKRGK